MSHKDHSVVRSKLPLFSSLNLSLAQSIIDSIIFKIVIVDSNHTILLINKIAIHRFSIDPQDFIGKKCPYFRPNAECPFCPLDKAEIGPSPEQCEYFDRESKRWFHSLVFPLPFVTGAGLHTFLLIVIDITDRKKAQAERDDAIRRYWILSNGTIEAIHNIVAKRDAFVGEHQKEVSRLSVAISEAMGLNPHVTEGIKIAAMIHDLGKIAVPSEILMRQGRLAENEYALIKTHPEEGYKILKSTEFPYPLAEIVYQHHERINGSGYPRGLAGADILIEAKVLAVAEVAEAMSAHRPYRPAIDIEEVLRHLEENRGVLYDTGVVDACVRLIRKTHYRFRKEKE